MALRSGRYHNLKHHKDAADQKRAAVFAKIGRLITMAVAGGASPKPEDNPKLRLALAKARAATMSGEAIERAIKKGTGEGAEGKQFDEVVYEGYAGGGIAVVVEATTDNRNRTAPELKKLFERFGGAIGAPGCVAWQFKQRSLVEVRSTDADAVMAAVLDGGADALDVVRDGDGVAVVAEPKDHDAVLKAMAAARLEVARSDITRLPDAKVAVADPAVAEQIQGLLDALDDHDDVQAVHHNAEFA